MQVQLAQYTPPSDIKPQAHSAAAFSNRLNNRFNPIQPKRFQPYPAGRRSREDRRKERSVASGDGALVKREDEGGGRSARVQVSPEIGIAVPVEITCGAEGDAHLGSAARIA